MRIVHPVPGQSTIYYGVHYGVVVGGGGVDAELMRPPPPQQCVSKLTIAARGDPES